MSKRGLANFERELDFTEQLIDADQKNYHVWSYRYPLLSLIDDPRLFVCAPWCVLFLLVLTVGIILFEVY